MQYPFQSPFVQNVECSIAQLYYSLCAV